MSNFINKSSLPDEDWVTSAEIIRFFGITKTTLWRWNQNRQIPRCLMGGTHYYPKNFIQQYMLNKLELPPNFNTKSDTAAATDDPASATDSDDLQNDNGTPETDEPTQPE